MKKVNTVQMNIRAYPDQMAIINELAELEDRTAHDVLKRLIDSAGKERIKYLKKHSSKASVTG